MIYYTTKHTLGLTSIVKIISYMKKEVWKLSLNSILITMHLSEEQSTFLTRAYQTGTLLQALVSLARRFDKMKTSPSFKKFNLRMNYIIYILLVTRKIILKNMYIARRWFLVFFPSTQLSAIKGPEAMGMLVSEA